MKSIQVANIIDQAHRPNYSDLQVLKSAAGWYIGTIHTDPKEGFQEPGSRDSDYYSSEERARYALIYLENLWVYERHTHCLEDIANKWAAQMYKLGYDPRQVGYRFFP